MRASGVETIDRAFGGLRPGLPLVLTGATAGRRSALALALVDAALARGEVAALLSPMPPAALLAHAAGLGLRLEAALRTGRLALLELDAAAPARLRRHGAEPFLAALRGEASGVDLLVIDPLTALTTDLHDAGAVRALLHGLTRHAGCGGGGNGTPAPCVVLTAADEVLRAHPSLEQELTGLCGDFARLVWDARGTPELRVERSRLAPPRAERAPSRSEGPTPVHPAPRGLGPGPARAAGGRPRVLLVEDDVTLRRMLSDWLAPHYDVSEAEDGYTALSEVLAEPPDVLVLDLLLPRIGGAELVAALVRAGSTTPVLVVSGRMARAADRVRILALGASDTLEKPVHKLELLRKIEMLAALPKRAPTERVALADAALLLGHTASTRVVDPSAFTERLRRARRFGELAHLPSTLLGLATDTPGEMDTVILLADAALRTEDAILPLGETAALLLLVASAADACEPVLRRLAVRLAESGIDPRRLRWRAVGATAVALPETGAPEPSAWKPCFEDLAPWPSAA